MRVGLWVLVIVHAVIGLWALAFPALFYENFPLPGRHWVSLLPAYNEHLLRDFGGYGLGFAVMFAVAAMTAERVLTRTVLAGYLVYAVPHLVFHLGHLAPFSVGDAAAQVVGLAALVVLPAVLLVVAFRPAPGAR
ncbi:hypothetical protein J5X84_01480 [Streptosporangiaceae bacterium NEAU-GS5]|nr:hypothetical protein [Streptosporangiaceae bacterium NEAU-GS5]